MVGDSGRSVDWHGYFLSIMVWVGVGAALVEIGRPEAVDVLVVDALRVARGFKLVQLIGIDRLLVPGFVPQVVSYGLGREEGLGRGSR